MARKHCLPHTAARETTPGSHCLSATWLLWRCVAKPVSSSNRTPASSVSPSIIRRYQQGLIQPAQMREGPHSHRAPACIVGLAINGCMGSVAVHVNDPAGVKRLLLTLLNCHHDHRHICKHFHDHLPPSLAHCLTAAQASAEVQGTAWAARNSKS